MDGTRATRRAQADPRIAILHAGIVALTLTTAAIHASLGGPLFTLNAIGYAGFALLTILPGPFAAARWLVRLALLGFTMATIGGWILFGARFGLAYVDKGVELVLVAALSIDIWLEDGGPAAVVRRSRALMAAGLARSGVRPR